jgi:hypothetical protein
VAAVVLERLVATPMAQLLALVVLAFHLQSQVLR